MRRMIYLLQGIEKGGNQILRAHGSVNNCSVWFHVVFWFVVLLAFEGSKMPPAWQAARDEPSSEERKKGD